ncbi:serine hydrolase [Streptomyces sp. TS71-3]|uniref:serine hydrolase domain-containing protein n=1 Tax=Streptomyces sp. TS71-3 TaxID=2733862 RepID=UPI001B1DDD30|nr:serine hydrolase domain-containing protein [Streptomyces sp. TS71-3]GHJ35915.1 serine hydrolase [Streptomyces sp. TS71-3]
MADLDDILAAHVGDGSGDGGTVPGAVVLVARGDQVDARAAGRADTAGGPPVARDSIFRIASVTKPVAAAAVMMLVEDGRIALDDPIGTWLPELAAPSVVRTPGSPIDDTVPAERSITVRDLLEFRAGWGFPTDFTLPVLAPLFGVLQQGAPRPQLAPETDTWIRELARVPMIHQPGEAWLYNTCSDIQGVLIARASGQGLPEFLQERIFEPLGMVDTGFAVPTGKLDRFTSLYRAPEGGGLERVDAPDGQWSSLPPFPSGAGGLVSTADDLLAFGRMLLSGGSAGDRRLLSAESVREMITNRLPSEQREVSALFLEGQGWGYGGAVDVARVHPWSVPGRYGWVGGTGTSAHIIPATGTVAVLLTQVEMRGPTSPAVMRDFWRYAAGRPGGLEVPGPGLRGPGARGTE